MGIELRRGSPYLYRKERHGDRVVSRYAGGGLLGLAGAMMDEEERVERRREADAWRAERGRMEEEDRTIAADFDRVESEARRILAEAGYHRTRGQWRKGRVDANTTTAAAPGEAAAPPARGEIGMDLLNRAIGGEEGPQEQLIGLMGDAEVGGKIVDFFGDLPRYAARVVIAEVAGEGPQSPLVIKALHKKLAALRAELEGPDASPIERLLAERAAYCWLVLWKYEHHLANAKDLPSKREDIHHRRIDAAHRRYLASLRTLAQVRKLALPAVQVNIGGNQVNVTGS